VGTSKTPLIDVALILFGSAGAALMAAGAVFSITGNSASMMLSAPRMLYALSRERMLPRWFGRIHPHWGTPANATIFVGGLALLLALSGSFIWLAAMSTVVRLLVYVACILSLPRLHTALAAGARPFDLPGGYFIPLVALVLCCWLITYAGGQSWLTTGIFAAIGTVFYLATFRRKQRVPTQ